MTIYGLDSPDDGISSSGSVELDLSPREPRMTPGCEIVRGEHGHFDVRSGRPRRRRRDEASEM
ncbi:MAG: hypothetical protein DMD75_16810 [Candidatus Rokuibacteriota bacterium]|nr:MAG: hypothetical protein DMD75_16810 [Candidatus Rokubacteria bacterium]